MFEPPAVLTTGARHPLAPRVSPQVGKDGTRSGWLTDNGRDVEAWLREGAATGAASLASSPKVRQDCPPHGHFTDDGP